MTIVLGAGNVQRRFAIETKTAPIVPAIEEEPIGSGPIDVHDTVRIAEATGNSGITEPIVDATGAAVFDQQSNTSIRDDDSEAALETNTLAQIGSFVAVRGPDDSVTVKRISHADTEAAGREKRSWFKLSMPEGAGVDPTVSGIVILMIQVTGETPEPDLERAEVPIVAPVKQEEPTAPLDQTPPNTADVSINDEMKE